MLTKAAGRGLLALGMMLSAGVRADERAAYPSLLTPLLQSHEDVLGDPLAYPPGQARITAALVVLAPGQQTGWHTHPVPLFAHVLEGELTVDYGTKGHRVYKAGDSVLEAMNWPHNGTNTGNGPVRLLAVYLGSDELPNTDPAEAPR